MDLRLGQFITVVAETMVNFDDLALLNYECDGCGACCRTFPIFASQVDASREPRIAAEGQCLPDHLSTPEWTFRLYPLPFLESCCFLDADNRCTVYATRPETCRAFAPGSDQCQEARARCGVQSLLPMPRNLNSQ